MDRRDTEVAEFNWLLLPTLRPANSPNRRQTETPPTPIEPTVCSGTGYRVAERRHRNL